MASCWTLSLIINDPTFFIPSKSPQRHLNPNFEWSAGTCIQHPHKMAHLRVAFVKILWEPSVHAHIWHVPIPCHSKWPHLEMASCWAPRASMLLHVAKMSTRLQPTKTSTSQPFWITCSWACLPSSSVHKLAHALSTRTKSELVKSHAFLLHFLGKLNCLLMLSSLNISCKPSIQWKAVQWHSLLPWQLALHPPMGGFIGLQARLCFCASSYACHGFHQGCDNSMRYIHELLYCPANLWSLQLIKLWVRLLVKNTRD